ncbi:MAG: hypothetical protein AUG51_23665 [Acidobacteria bacterium 13_1_20CM_3_53_8]|nr:MAG: hypothetical protein AUG51_23665 [Acidobacteria bacterium 13_1_20CM_3_53_8]
MARKKVLIVEDKERLRISLYELLDARGFEVYSAGRVAEARKLVEEHGEEFDVAVLDMRLEDPDEPNITGADIGIEFRYKKKGYPPEFLIYSAHPEVDYYRLALKLGVAAYLAKQVENEIDVVRHVKVLALRHALSSENPVTADRVARIAAQSHSRFEAIVKFCHNILKPEFESCLGAPFIILLSEGNSTQNCSDNADLPQASNPFYHTLQALAHGKGSPIEPFVLKRSELEAPTDAEAAKLYEKLNGAAFVPLSISRDFRLSIGILQEQESEKTPVPEDAKALCKILAQYLRPTVLENLLHIWPRWTELRATRTSTAKLCLFVGQELKDMLPAEETGGSLAEDSLWRMRNLANDLVDTGELLNDLQNRRWDEKSSPVSIKEIAETSWRWITQAEEVPGKSFEIVGDCTVEADRRDLEIAVSRLLHWLAQRRAATPFDEEPLVSLQCRKDEDGPIIVFEDKSQRLNKELRANMFAPFTQAVQVPFTSEAESLESKGHASEAAAENVGRKRAGRYLPLYLAKVLVEGRYHGTLEDHSDDEDLKELTYRHRIVMRFPPSRNKD